MEGDTCLYCTNEIIDISRYTINRTCNRYCNYECSGRAQLLRSGIRKPELMPKNLDDTDIVYIKFIKKRSQ